MIGRRRLLAAIAAALLLVSACGGDDAGDAPSEQIIEMQAEINRLKAELDLATTGTTSVGATTVTLAPGQSVDLVPIFDSIFSGMADRIAELGETAQRANTSWENRVAEYDATFERFLEVVSDAAAISDLVTLLPIPAELTARYADIATAIEEFELAARALLAGLEAPDDGTLRRNAADRVAETASRVITASAFG